MRLVLIALFSLLSLTGFGQTGFPTTITNTPSVRSATDELEQRCMREGLPYPTAIETNNTVWTGQNQSGGQGVGNLTPPNGYAYYLKSVSLSATRKVRAKGVFGYYPIGNTTATFNAFTFGGDAGSTTINVGSLIKQGMPNFAVNIVSLLDADPLVSLAQAVHGSTNLVTTKNSTITPLSNQQYSYSITVTNTTGTSTTGTVTLTDVLPAGARFVAGTGTGWTVSAAGQTVTATLSTTLANNSVSAPVSITVAPTVNVSITGAGNGYIIDCDTDFSATHIMPVVGTSISAGTGATSYKTMYTMQLRNWLRDSLGYSIRRINRAISGSNSSQHEELRKFDNRYDFDTKTGILLYEHGINDEAQGLSIATTQANIRAMARHKKSKAPDMTMLVLAPFPVTNSTNEAGLATRSVAMQAAVTALNDPKVIFISSTRTCLNPATDTTDGIHPNDTGNAKIFAAIRDEIISRNIQFGLLLIAFPVRRRRKTRDRNPAANQPKTRTRLRDRFRC